MINQKKVLTPAKINLFFEANGLYPNGYHDITSVMQTVSLYDSVEIDLNRSKKIEVAVSNMPSLSGINNLAYKAAKLFFETAKLTDFGANIRIEKAIPLLSGLGGGSADAAAVLLGINKMLDEPFTTQELINIGKQIGADLPFCLVQGTALVKGIGEDVKPCTKLPDCFIVIITHGEKQSTADMYKKLDEIEGRNPRSINSFLKAMEHGDLKKVASNLYNAFSEFYTKDDIISQCLAEFGALGHCISGSGPSQFAIFDNPQSAQAAVDFLSEKNIESHLVKPIISQQ